MLPLLALIALVTTDEAALRAAPRDSAPKQAVLWQGDALEVRGERLGYLQVYDHRRERAGYVRAWQVRTWEPDEAHAAELLAIVRFLRDTPEREALGIAHAALFLKAAPAVAIGTEVFDALGTMADRLARRASQRFAISSSNQVAGHLDVVRGYGIGFASFPRDDRTQVCADGEAFRRVLALGGTDEERVRAALGLTRPECVDPALPPVTRRALDEWRADVLGRVDLAKTPDFMASRVRLRRAVVDAALAFERTRQGETDRARAAGEASHAALAGVDRRPLADDELAAYDEAAMRVGASRWAAAVAFPPPSSLHLETSARPTGETCLRIVRKTGEKPLIERCTYGVAWAASARTDHRETALAVAVQPTDSWRELWVFHEVAGAWTVDVLAPGTDAEVGYLELAGFSPDASRVVAAREVRTPAGARRTFEVLRLDTLQVEKQSTTIDGIGVFKRWQDPAWRAETVALR
jgi:hypothetical protein